MRSSAFRPSLRNCAPKTSVVINSAVDRSWSQYFCCMLAGNADFVHNNPIATKRVVRAILKAADLCVPEPQRVARQIVDDGFTANYDYALQTMTDVPYNKWREYYPEDTIRFYALRLQEAGMIRSGPQKIIASATMGCWPAPTMPPTSRGRVSCSPCRRLSSNPRRPRPQSPISRACCRIPVRAAAAA